MSRPRESLQMKLTTPPLLRYLLRTVLQTPAKRRRAVYVNLFAFQ